MATHIQSGERYEFVDFSDLERFIRRQLDRDRVIVAAPESDEDTDVAE